MYSYFFHPSRSVSLCACSLSFFYYVGWLFVGSIVCCRRCISYMYTCKAYIHKTGCFLLLFSVLMVYCLWPIAAIRIYSSFIVVRSLIKLVSRNFFFACVIHFTNLYIYYYIFHFFSVYKKKKRKNLIT